LSDFVREAEPELAANAMLCAVNQAAYLLRRQLESQGRTFLKEGGFTEKLHAARTQVRSATNPAAPLCPKCGKPMTQRTAKAGSHAGSTFWGCGAYPNCKGTRPIDSSDQSDPSDKNH
jgi:four helix bundle suffix protein